MNEIAIFGNTERLDAAKKLDAAGYPPLRSGLGVAPGNYSFITPMDANIYATKQVGSGERKFGLTLLAGMLKGKDEHNKHEVVAFGLTATDKQFVVTYDQWMSVEPNQNYDVVINEKGRVASIVLYEDEDIVETSKVVTKAKKAKAISI